MVATSESLSRYVLSSASGELEWFAAAATAKALLHHDANSMEEIFVTELQNSIAGHASMNLIEDVQSHIIASAMEIEIFLTERNWVLVHKLPFPYATDSELPFISFYLEQHSLSCTLHTFFPCSMAEIRERIMVSGDHIWPGAEWRQAPACICI